MQRLGEARILIVDDEEDQVRLLERILCEAGFRNVFHTTDPRRALSLFIECRPDLVVLDLMMPHLDGLKLAKQLGSRIPDGSFLPILVITGDSSQAARQAALSAGAKDFVAKPFDSTEILLRTKNLLETRLAYLALEDQNRLLDERVRERTQELEDTQMEILERLALAAEYRDDETGKHAQRVGELSAKLARRLGLPDEQVRTIHKAAIIHDLGKVGVSDSILHKPGQLSGEEFDQVRPHTVIGAGILSGSRSRLLQMAEEIALYHHERWDSTGYSGLGGESVPVAARIVSLADAFDVMTHGRPYRKALPLEEAAAEIRREREKQFDPAVADALLELLRDEGALKEENLARSAGN